VATNFVGIEIGGTKLQLVAGRPGAIEERKRFAVDVKRGGAGIREQLEGVLPGLVKQWDARAVALGFGGPVDRCAGRIARSHQIEGWSSFEVRAWLAKLSGTQVVIDNDANMAALGEATLGAGKGRNPVYYVTLGSGVGGGLAIDGQIYHGAAPGEAEVGHLRLDRDGTIVEQRCSGWAVDRAIRERATGVLRELIGQATGGEARHLARALELKDESARAILDETARTLAFALSHVVHLFHPEVIVIGGGLSLVGEPLRGAIEGALQPSTMEVFRGTTEVHLAGLGEDAVPIGCLVAASLQFEQRVTGVQH
jgi:glucokinase